MRLISAPIDDAESLAVASKCSFGLPPIPDPTRFAKMHAEQCNPAGPVYELLSSIYD